MSRVFFDLKMIGATDQTTQLGLTLGRISAVHRNQYRLYTEQGEMNAEAIGALLYRAGDLSALPVVGDWVAAEIFDSGLAMIHEVLPRRTKISRRSVGKRDMEQVIAANVDLILIVCGLDGDFSARRIERYLTLAHESGAQAAIVLSKADLCENLSARIDEVRGISRGAAVVCTSAVSEPGIDAILPWLGRGLTVVLLGSSGAGKSTLVNQLLGEERQVVQEVRESDSRGKHTTTHRELIPLPMGGALIDTPGMRELQLWAGQDSLDSAFDDIAELALRCRFGNCAHNGEIGCAVKEAITDGRIDTTRWESYLKLRAEVRWHERQSDRNASRVEKQKWKVIHKAMRARYKERE